MKRWTLVAAAAAVLLAGAGWWLATRDYGPPCGPCPVGVPEPPPGPEAVLAIAAGRDGTEAAVVRAGGRVDFVALSDGKVRGNIDTGAKAWAVRYPHAGEMPPGFEFRHDENTLLAGIPAASVGGRTVAVNGAELLQWNGIGKAEVLARNPAFAGARLAAHRGPGSAVHVALADGRIARMDPGGGVAFSAPLPGSLTCLAAAEGAVLAGGESPSWHLVSEEDPEDVRQVPLHRWTPPVLAITVAEDGRSAVLSHGMCLTDLAEYSLSGFRSPTRGRTFVAKPPGPISLAFDPGEGRLHLGMPSGGTGTSGDWGYQGFPLGGNPQRGLALLEGGDLLVHGWEDGTLMAESVPEGKPRWGTYPSRVK